MRGTMSCGVCAKEFKARDRETMFCSVDCYRKRKRKSAEELFWAKVDKNGPVPSHQPELGKCWLWLAAKDVDGYGSFGDGRAHRFSFSLAAGRAPKMLVCHKCDNPPCVNPDHLFEGTPKDNTLDMVRKGRYHSPMATKTHCPKGHEYAGRNLIVERYRLITGKTATRRHCRACHLPRNEMCRKMRIARKTGKYTDAELLELRAKLKEQVERP